MVLVVVVHVVVVVVVVVVHVSLYVHARRYGANDKYATQTSAGLIGLGARRARARIHTGVLKHCTSLCIINATDAIHANRRN